MPEDEPKDQVCHGDDVDLEDAIMERYYYLVVPPSYMLE